jgi:enterochelin esterase-like enzyme
MTVYERKIIKESVTSSHLKEPRNIRVSLPPGYNELLSYPIVYCQDGEDFFNFGRIVTQANNLILEEGVEPFLIVGVDVDKSVRRSEYHPEGSRFRAYCSFFAEEMVPFIENKYPARASSSERVLAGDSLGGTVALHLALDYPQLFTRVIAFSGAFYHETQQRIRAEADLSWMTVFQTVGRRETAFETADGVHNFVEMNRDTKRLLSERNAVLQYQETDGEHVWGQWQSLIPESLKYYFS